MMVYRLLWEPLRVTLLVIFFCQKIEPDFLFIIVAICLRLTSPTTLFLYFLCNGDNYMLFFGGVGKIECESQGEV